MDEKFMPLFCQDNDVVSFGDMTYKISKVNKAITESCDDYLARTLISQANSKGVKIDNKLSSNDTRKLFNEGIDCEILKTDAKGWRKGKLKIQITIELMVEKPEKPQSESPLDDIRQGLKKNEQ